MRSTLPDNRTIQNIVRHYVEEYAGRYPVACNMSVLFAVLTVKRTPFSEIFFYVNSISMYFYLLKMDLTSPRHNHNLDRLITALSRT